jgi:hypothetical protein
VLSKPIAAALAKNLTLTMASSFPRPSHGCGGPPSLNRAEDGSNYLSGS